MNKFFRPMKSTGGAKKHSGKAPSTNMPEKPGPMGGLPGKSQPSGFPPGTGKKLKIHPKAEGI